MFPLKQLLLLIVLVAVLPANAQQARIDLTQEMVEATNAFVSSLSVQQRNNGIYTFEDEERFNWHFIPRDRKGVPFRSMNDSQRAAAQNVLQTFFSAKGYQRAEAVRSLESVLAEIEVNGRFDRDPELYFLTIFGTPGLDSNWALRYEGHHLAYNWTFVSGMGIASSPQFFGSNPAEVRSGEKIGTRVLSVEEDLGRDLVSALSADQKKMAILDLEVPGDIFTAAEREITRLENSGISYSELNSRQKRMLIALIDELASMQSEVIAEARMASIRSEGLEDIKFVWIGGIERGDPHYYRVQGSGFLIEYDNTQNNANHIHLVWRDFTGDFGRDLIRMHYQAAANGFGATHNH
ncbi:MAG: DUF3500 domain-containing protein [Pseudohongiellaceae bacterium]|tara:strand:- start:830 stop:1882 length:1053 start_codon:yes stop_codon:yes gene_type:complete